MANTALSWHSLARRAEPIDFNATAAHPAFSHLNESSIRVLQGEADRLASPALLDGFSVATLVALFAIYLGYEVCMFFMKTFFYRRWYALPARTQRQCGGLLASALAMSAPVPLQGYALSAAKWDITVAQIRLVHIAAIIVTAFCLFDLIHRDRAYPVLFIQRTISLAAISFQVVMFDRVHDPSFIITLSALLFVAITEPPCFFGLFLYKIRCPAKWTKFVLHSAVGQTIFVKVLAAVVGVYVWVKFQRTDSSTLGRASSVVYLASLIGLLTCQFLAIVPLRKLLKEIDERYAKKGPLELAPPKSAGGRSKNGRRKKGDDRSQGSIDQHGHLHSVHGRMKRHANDRLSTFNMANLHRDSLEMDEKRQSDDLEIGSSFKSMTPGSTQRDLPASEKSWSTARVKESLRSLSPTFMGRKSPSTSRPSNKKRGEALEQQPSISQRQLGSSDYSDSRAPTYESTDMRNVQTLDFNGNTNRNDRSQFDAMTPTASTSGRGSSELYASPPTTRRPLDGPGSLNIREDNQPQIIISAASSADHGRDSEAGSTLHDHGTGQSSVQVSTPTYELSGWTRTSTGGTVTALQSATSNGGSGAGTSRNGPIQRISTFSPHAHQLSSSLNTTDDTSRYALGIVQEYLEPAENEAQSGDYEVGYEGQYPATSSATTPSVLASNTSRGNAFDEAGQPSQYGNAYSGSRFGARPRQTATTQQSSGSFPSVQRVPPPQPHFATRREQLQYQAQQQQQLQQQQQQQQQQKQQQQNEYQQQHEPYPDYGELYERQRTTSGSQPPPFLSDLG